MIKVLRFTNHVSRLTLPQILLASLIVATPIQIAVAPKAQSTSICGGNGVRSESSENGFTVVNYQLTSTANNAATSCDSTFTVPAGVTQVEFLLVSGGGGGGHDGGGGGGGGGVLYYKNWNVSPAAVINLKVGAGGAPASTSCSAAGNCPEGGTGVASIFDSQTVQGGGGGGGRDSDGVASEGSGGGAGHTGTRAGGDSTGDSDLIYVTYGNNGGANSGTYGGGGGGSAELASEGVGVTGGAGGAGFSSTIEGTSRRYGGGGGGGTYENTATRAGGDGGGGQGGNGGASGVDGINGRGGGGGGGGNASRTAGRGGGGVIIIRYQNSCSISSPTTYNTGVGFNSKNLVRITSSNAASSCTGSWAVPANVTSIEVFVLGGGGGGGGKLGAGGGSGGAIHSTAYSVSGVSSVSLTIGGGGRGGSGQWNQSASAGSNSIFGSLVAYGGGLGGDEYDNGGSGGSSGGGGGGNGSTATSSGPTLSSGVGDKFGNKGGDASPSGDAYGSGGGGGLGGDGGAGSRTNGGNGGAGISIYGYSLGGGGGGGVNSGIAGTANDFGGGAGSNSGDGVDGTPATGGGGGGGRNSTSAFGGDGGSGVIIILYAVNLTLTFNSNYGTPTTTTQTVPSNTSTNLSANSFSRTGYTFANWNTQANGLGTSYANSAAISISATSTLYAQWTANTLSITYNSQGGTSIDPGSTTTGGSIAASPGTPVRAGYNFLGWATASYGTPITYSYTHNQTSNFTLYAQWSARSLTITYNTQGGSTIPNGSVLTGSFINPAPATPTRAGYTFNGWFAAATGGTAISNFSSYNHNQTSNFTLYAQWSAQTLNITYDANNGTSPNGGSATTVTGGTISSLPTTGRSGFTFNGWFTSSAGGTRITTTEAHTQTANFTLYAQWTGDALSPTFSTPTATADGFTVQISNYSSDYTWAGTATASGSVSINGSGLVTVTGVSPGTSTTASITTTRTGYTGGSATVTGTSTTGAALTPTFSTPSATADGFTVQISNYSSDYTWAGTATASGSVSINGSGLVTVTGVAANTLSVLTITTTRAGYASSNATIDKTSLRNSALVPEINDVTPTLDGFIVSQKNFGSSFTYTLTSTNGAQATMDTATGLITVTNLSPGTSSTITITTTRDNYETGAATVDGSPIPNKTVTFDANGGTGSMSSQVARTSTALTLNNFTRQFYVFNGWNENSNGTGNTYTDGQAFSFASNLTLYAIWTPISLTVTFNSQGGSSVDTSTTTYNGKISTAPTQPTRDGYTFLGWFTESSDGTAITFEYVHNQSANFTLYAQWSANTLNITYDANGGTTPAGGLATTRTGSTISTLATTSRDGYTFNGWFTQSSGGTQITTSAAHNQTASFTLYAQWSADALTNVITFNSVSTQIYGTSLDLASYVSATSGLTVTLASSTTAICTISTTTVTAIAAGTCMITASQSGNGSYPAASNVSRSFTVSKKVLTITVAGLNANFGDSISNPTYTQSGLVTSLGDAISTPTFYYTGTSATYYPRSTSKPTQVGIYTISILSISLSAGKIGNYEVSFVSSELVISSVASNTISSLTIRASSGDVSSNLLSNFDNATTNYQIYVSEAVSGVVVNLTRAGASLVSMQVKINESGWRRINFSSNSASSGVVPLPAATNTLLVSTVSSDKGVKQFTITIYRDTKTAPRTGSTASPVPTVSPTPAGSALSTVRFFVNNSGDISSGLQTVSLSPTFNQSVTSYTATFTNTQSAAVMKADFTAAGVTLRLKINNGPFTSIPSTGASSTISLNVGSNTAILRVTSTDGTSRDYTFTLTRSAAAAGLTPSFGSPTATSDGFTVQISNYSSSYSWGVTTTVGSATINDSGLITVTGLSASATTIAVTSRRSGYANARSTLTYP